MSKEKNLKSDDTTYPEMAYDEGFDEGYQKVIKDAKTGLQTEFEQAYEEGVEDGKRQAELVKLVQKVKDWSVDKGINEAKDWRPQFSKVEEEVGEYKEELEKSGNQEARGKDERVELGDVLVTLIIMAQQRGYELEDCLSLAYDKIKGRKGKTLNGVFVKEQDL